MSLEVVSEAFRHEQCCHRCVCAGNVRFGSLGSRAQFRQAAAEGGHARVVLNNKDGVCKRSTLESVLHEGIGCLIMNKRMSMCGGSAWVRFPCFDTVLVRGQGPVRDRASA